MIVFTGTSFVPTTVLIILFVILGIQLTPLSQFIYAQTVDNEIIENTLEQVEKATAGISAITESLNNASKATDSTNTSDSSILYDQSEFKDSARNWINGESDTLSFTYPSNWNVNISDSRFDNYEFIITDKASNSSIQVSDEALSSSNKILHGTNLERYFSMYMLEHSPLSSDSSKIDTYPKGKVSIAGLPAYSELYLDQGYVILVSLAFQEGNDRHYTVIAKSHSSNYDSLEPILLDIIKSITPKTIEKQLEREVEIPFNNTNSVDLRNTKDIQQLQKEDPISNESLVIKQQQQPQNTLTIKEALEQTFGKENTTELDNQTVVVVNDTDSKIGQEEEQSKPISDDMLEYAEEIFPILSNSNLSREDKVKILNQQFTDPELFLKNWKSLEDSIDSLDDPIERELPLSNTIQSNNTSDQSQTIEQRQQQQENDSLTQQPSNIYEGLGIKIHYFDPWTVLLQSDKPSCSQIDFCYLQLTTSITAGLENSTFISITQDKSDSPKIKNKCKCDTLQNYVRYQYENHVSILDNFSFINDNQTTISNDNKPAIQLEYDFSLANSDNKGFDIFTKNDQSFYHFNIIANKKGQYSKYIDDFKKMINSIEFVSNNDSKKKQPSFMTSTEPEKQTQPSFMSSEESNKSISSISNNENEMNFSDLEIPKQLDINQISNELTILSHNSYINSIGDMHIIGEVENNTPTIKQFVQVIATFYDNNNKVVGTSNTYTTPTDLETGETAPFDLILTDASIPIEQIERYALKVSGQ